MYKYNMIPFYVYKIVNIVTKQYYFGSRYAHVNGNTLPVDDLWIRYFTSSRTVANLIKSLGKDSFEFSILFEEFDEDAVYWYEQEIIKLHITDSLCLNKKFQNKDNGDTIFNTANKPSWNKGVPSKKKGVSRSDEIKLKISIGRKGKGLGKPSINKGCPMSEKRYAQHLESVANRKKLIGSDNPFYGKTHSDETRALIAANTSKAHKGRVKPKMPCTHCGLMCAAHTMGRHLKSCASVGSK